ncbi:MAG: cyclophilin-like fold protein [Clostridia bacterium]|nr:cyclophilin-like fold protein [Clostridia bacterium]
MRAALFGGTLRRLLGLGLCAVLLCIHVACGEGPVQGEGLADPTVTEPVVTQNTAVPTTAELSTPLPEVSEPAVQETNETEETEMKLYVQVGETTFTASLNENEAVDALLDLLKEAPLTIRMRDYGGFEKVGALGVSLPASDSRTTTQAGDIVLYNGNQIVIFYGSNTWSYTRLGSIDDLSFWAEALGSGELEVTFSIGGME